MENPKIFIASSGEAEDLVPAIELVLTEGNWAFTKPWTAAGTFPAGSSLLQSLRESARDSTFAVVLYTPETRTVDRGVVASGPRDNVLFELGFFLGWMDPERVAVMCPVGPLKIPSDYAGYRLITYDPSNGAPAEFLRRPALEVRQHFQDCWRKALRGGATVAAQQLPASTTEPPPAGLIPIVRDAEDTIDWYREFEDSMDQVPPSLNSRLLYYGPGLAGYWARMIGDNRAYAENNEVFQKTLPAVLARQRADHLNVVDLGVGDFAKGRAILQSLLAILPPPVLHYFPLDISYDMLTLAMSFDQDRGTRPVIRQVLRNGTITAIHAKFSHLSRYRHLFASPGSRSLFLLLGNTLGNEWNEVTTLFDIGQAMAPGDVLLVELQAVGDPPKSAEQVTLEQQRNAYFYTGPFTALGWKQSEVSLRVEVDSPPAARADAAPVTYKFICQTTDQRPRLITHPGFRHPVRVPNGDIFVYIVRTYRLAGIRPIFEAAGFEVRHIEPGQGGERGFYYVIAEKASTDRRPS